VGGGGTWEGFGQSGCLVLAVLVLEPRVGRAEHWGSMWSRERDASATKIHLQWQAAIRDLDVPRIRLHDARHTCATLMHLQGVPIALVAAWARPRTCPSLSALTSTPNQTRSNSRPGALLRRPLASGTDAIARPCGDTRRDPVTIFDNLGRAEHACDLHKSHTAKSKTNSKSG
jgi:hypothetical protein